MNKLEISKEFEVLCTIIKNRRSVFPKQYTGLSVPDHWVKMILENARWAPNHKKTEPWRFHVFSGKSLEKLSVYMGDHYVQNTPEEKFSERKHQKRMKSPLVSSHVIAICVQYDPEERLPEWEELAAVACAVQNMWLSCTALGLGAYWSTPEAALEADGFLKLSEGQKCIGLFYIGQKDKSMTLHSDRDALDSKVTWHD